jgi:hypothetical protein
METRTKADETGKNSVEVLKLVRRLLSPSYQAVLVIKRISLNDNKLSIKATDVRLHWWFRDNAIKTKSNRIELCRDNFINWCATNRRVDKLRGRMMSEWLPLKPVQGATAGLTTCNRRWFRDFKQLRLCPWLCNPWNAHADACEAWQVVNTMSFLNFPPVSVISIMHIIECHGMS